jgi:CRISPR/Cas system-associated protein Csm6
MYQFSGLIKCLNCSSNFRGKQQRDKKVYICSLHSRDSSKCIRNVIREEELIYVVSKHIELQGKSINGELSEYVKLIEVNKQGGYIVYYKDKSGSKSIIDPDSQEYGIKLKF